ncbi:HD domain-containing protein [bacterium]|nr:HD domain-containing protein [bacterium]
MKRIAILSRYPEFNPNLIFRLDFEGKILYHNPAVEQFIKKFGSPGSSMAELLPHSVQEYVEQCIGPRQGNCQVEVERFGRAIHYNISTFQDQRSLFVDGTDVTRMKDLERDLRELNQNLEQKVQERTDELRQTQDVTIVGLAGLAETRDPETGEHLERTRMYVKTLAVTLQDHPRFRRELTEQTIDSLYKSTPLHDIGKVGIRDAVLRKPGRLTEDEFEEMKLHAIHGGKALEKTEEKLGFDSFLRIAKEIAYYHHEKWDGSGYPFGLKEDAIPVAARLMAIADVYDALVSKRVYKDAFPHEKAVSIIAEGKGKHFDPDMVDAFMKIHEQFQAIAREYKDEEENDLYGKKLNEYTVREQGE